jgi:hypothetical protein
MLSMDLADLDGDLLAGLKLAQLRGRRRDDLAGLDGELLEGQKLAQSTRISQISMGSLASAGKGGCSA